VDVKSSVFWDVADELYCTPIGSLFSLSEPVGCDKLSCSSLIFDI
jgi:hypothetical protein